MNKYANRNTFWAHLFVEELWRSGLQSVVIAPGSRSTPLALAFDSYPEITSYVHPDERGAAFMALGLALGSGNPVAVLATSGTAVANFFPAIVEAHRSNVPLLALTADRPPELRDSGTNQAIDQIKLFGDYVRWFVEAPLPETNPDDILLAALRSLAGRALAAATNSPAGPVHINFPFRKPLEPILVTGDVPEVKQQEPTDHGPYVTISQGRLVPDLAQLEELADLIGQAKRGLIYAGPRCPGGDFPAALFRLAWRIGFPILADSLSGLRFFAGQVEGEPLLLSGYETFLKSPAVEKGLAPDLIIQFGALPISKSLGDFLQRAKKTRRIQINALGSSHNWADDAFNTSLVVQAEPVLTCQMLFEHLAENFTIRVDQNWVEALRLAEESAWQVIDEVRREENFEGGLLADLLDYLREGDGLFVASSLPIRHLDQFGRARPLGLSVFANRGVSGIDGTLASAAGVAASNLDRRVVLVIGDLAFFHDLNSLLAVRNYAPNLVIILINNDGGGIFERLPIAEFEPPYSRLFRVPHGLHFKAAADLFALDYQAAEPGASFRNILQAILGQDEREEVERVVLIEVKTDAGHHEEVRREIIRRFQQDWISALEQK